MSLINQVLLDLEKRHASESELKPLPPYVRAVPGSSRSGTLSMAWVVAAVLAVAAVGAFVYLYGGDFARPVDLPQPVATALKLPAPDPVRAPEQVAVAPVPEAPSQTITFTPVSRMSDQLSLLPPPVVRQDKSIAIERSANVRSEETAPKPRSLATGNARVPVAAKPSKSVTSNAPEPAAAVAESTQSDALAPSPVATQLETPAKPDAPIKAQSSVKAQAPVKADAPINADVPIKTQEPSKPEAPVIAPPAPKADAPGAIDKQMREVVPAERAEIAFRKGVAQIREGRANAAEVEFRDALKLDPSHTAAFQALLGLLLDSGRNGEAEQLLRKALDLNPRQPRYAMVLARLEIERGEISTAVNTMVGVLPYVQSDPDFYAFLAALLQREGRHREAVDYYRTALRTVPGQGVWMMGLGISLRASNQIAEARDAFQRALASKQLSSELQDFVERQLRELSLQKKK